MDTRIYLYNGIQTMEDSFHEKEHTAASDAAGRLSQLHCCVEGARHKRGAPLAFHIYKVQKQAKRISDDRSQDSSYP